jgi:hypothetical protein
MLREFGRAFLMPSAKTMLAKIAVVGALVAALALTGCGRKTGLDAPPTVATPQQNAAGQPEHEAIGPDGKAVASPPIQQKRVPWLDWLIN